MRSMPPASSHFAESPVPAPPPMIGWPRRTMSRNRSINMCRSTRGMSGLGSYFQEMVGKRFGERLVIDGEGQPQELAVRGRAERRFEGGEQRLVRLRIVEGLSRRVERRDAFIG